MSLQFVFGGSGSGKSHYIYKKIIEQAKRDNRQYLILVPDQFTMQTQKDLCTFPDNDREGIMNIDVLSFSRLSHRIMEETGQKQGIMLDDTGKNLVLRRVAGEKKDELTVIGANLKKIGYIHEVKSVISEFYQYDIGDKELDELIEYAKNKGALAHKLKDLQILRAAFADYIRDKYITTEELLERLCHILPDSEIVRGSVIVLDGFTGFTPIQNKLVRQLMTLSSEMLVTLVMDDIRDLNCTEEQLFYLSRHTYETLSGIAKEEGVERARDIVLGNDYGGNVARFRDNQELGFLERNLFRNRQSYDGDVTKIHISEAASPREEVQAMLCNIQRLIRTEGYQYREIAVVVGDMTNYEHLLKTEFDYYGVPLYMDQTKGILFHPMSEFLRAMLEMLLNDFSKDSVMRFLRTGLTDLTREEVDRLENYIIRFGIRGRKSYGRLFTKGADVYTIEELSAINKSRQVMMELLNAMLEVTKKEEFEAGLVISALYDVCVSSGLQNKMELYRQKFEAENNLAKAREYAQVYKAVIDLLSQMHALLSGGELTLSEFFQIFEAGLGEITIGTIPQNVDQIVAGDIERTRLKQVRALFFIGVNDGAVPKNTRGGGLLSDMEREFLCRYCELSPTPRQQIFVQRLYLYLNMTKPSEQLFLSYARVNNEGRNMRKSYLISNLQKLFPKLRITDYSEGDIFSKIAGKEDGLDDLAALFSQYAAGLLEKKPDKKKAFFALLDAYIKEGGKESARFLGEAAFYRYEPCSLPAEIARALYGDIVESSVGRLEQFFSCAYAHFLQYGMKLKEQKEYDVDYADIGNIYHEVMKLFAEYLKEKGWHFSDFPVDEADLFVEETVEKLAKEYGYAIFYSSADNLYIVKDMTEILKRSIHTLRYHFMKGMFEPRSFEVPFYVGEKIKTKGRIDRIDTFTKDNELYVKVVDYKSGKKEFDPAEFYFGLNMQLAVYMRAAVLLEEEQHPDKEVVPAALVYYQLQNPYVDAEAGGFAASAGEEDVEEKIRDKMKITGLVSEEEMVLLAMDREFETESDVMPVRRKKDGSLYKNSITGTKEQFGLLMDYADYKIKEAGERVYQGEITVNPYEKKDGDACEFCSFRGVCHYDEKVDGYQKRRLDAMESEEAWDRIGETVKNKR